MCASAPVEVSDTLMYPSYWHGASADALKLTTIGADTLGSILIELTLRDGLGDPNRGIAASSNTVELALMFVIVKLRDKFGFPSPTWKLKEAGAAVTVAFNDAAMFRIPAPVCCAVPDAGLAALISSDRNWALLSPGLAALSRAAAPATTGPEKLIPCVIVNPLGSNISPFQSHFWVAV